MREKGAASDGAKKQRPAARGAGKRAADGKESCAACGTGSGQKRAGDGTSLAAPRFLSFRLSVGVPYRTAIRVLPDRPRPTAASAAYTGIAAAASASGAGRKTAVRYSISEAKTVYEADENLLPPAHRIGVCAALQAGRRKVGKTEGRV